MGPYLPPSLAHIFILSLYNIKIWAGILYSKDTILSSPIRDEREGRKKKKKEK